MSRLTDEDLVNIEQVKEERMRQRHDSSNEEKTTRAESLFGGMPQVEMTDELESNIIHRGKTYLSIKKSMMIGTTGKSDDTSAAEIL